MKQKYKVKEENIKKLQIYLKKQNERVGKGVFNTVGWGKQSDDGDNLITEDGLSLLMTEDEETSITEELSISWGGWGLAYDNSWFGQTEYER